MTDDEYSEHVRALVRSVLRGMGQKRDVYETPGKSPQQIRAEAEASWARREAA